MPDSPPLTAALFRSRVTDLENRCLAAQRIADDTTVSRANRDIAQDHARFLGWLAQEVALLAIGAEVSQDLPVIALPSPSFPDAPPARVTLTPEDRDDALGAKTATLVERIIGRLSQDVHEERLRMLRAQAIRWMQELGLPGWGRL